MTTVLTNPGLVELAAITTMGVSVKEGDSPIGYFGTGFKYAIACLLRNGHKVTLFRGLERFDFTTREELVRGKPFRVVCMNDVSLGFTDQLGRNWELWMAFRELYSNCLDEGGQCIVGRAPQAGFPGDTTIVVTGNDFDNVARNKDAIFLESSPLFAKNGLEIHKGQSERIFFRNVRAHDVGAHTLLTYNIVSSDIVLTEDRTIKDVYGTKSFIGRGIARDVEDESILRKILSCSEGSFEWGIDYSWSSMSDAIIKVGTELSKRQKIPPTLQAHLDRLRKERRTETSVELDELQTVAYEKAQDLLMKLKLRIDKVSIEFVEDEFVEELAYDEYSYDEYSKSAKISLAVFEQGAAGIAKVLLKIFGQHKAYNGSTSLAEILAGEYVSLAQRYLKEYL